MLRHSAAIASGSVGAPRRSHGRSRLLTHRAEPPLDGPEAKT